MGAPLFLKASQLGMMHARLLLVGISVAAGSLRGGLQAGTATPFPNETSTVATPITTPLPVVESATNLASAASPRPTSCPPAYSYVHPWCSTAKRGSGIFKKESEWDACSCGISRYEELPGPECEASDYLGVAKPSPYWGTGYNGCRCWCHKSNK